MEFSFPDYKTPTWKLGDDSKANWLELRRQAMHAILTGENGGFEQVKRNAEVSTNNKHQCFSCYCCACWAVLSEIKHQALTHSGPWEAK